MLNPQEIEILSRPLPTAAAGHLSRADILELEAGYQVSQTLAEKVVTLATLLAAGAQGNNDIQGLLKICRVEREAGLRSTGGIAWVSRVQLEVAQSIAQGRDLDSLAMLLSGDEVMQHAAQIRFATASDAELLAAYVAAVERSAATIFLVELARRGLRPGAHPLAEGVTW